MTVIETSSAWLLKTYRCIQLNPHLGELAVVDTSGVVLIDELDLHLHPNWQKTLVADLKAALP